MIHNQSAFNQTNLTKGFLLTLLRNMGFTIVLISCIHNNDDSMIRCYCWFYGFHINTSFRFAQNLVSSG